MTLGEAKKQVLCLLDEYSSGGETIKDPDIEKRLNPLFDAAQKTAALRCPVRKRVAVTGNTFTPDTKTVRCLGFYDSGGKRIFPEFSGDTAVLPEGCSADLLVMPQDITDLTPDDYSFEIKEALCPALPYFVAAGLNIVDLVVSPQYLLSCYDRITASSQATPYTGTVSAL